MPRPPSKAPMPWARQSQLSAVPMSSMLAVLLWGWVHCRLVHHASPFDDNDHLLTAPTCHYTCSTYKPNDSSNSSHVNDISGCDHALNSSSCDHTLNSNGCDHALDSSSSWPQAPIRSRWQLPQQRERRQLLRV